MRKTHKDLDVWIKAIEFVTSIYEVTSTFPKSEHYGLSVQIRRASVSIPSNIAEGAARKSKIEFRQFLFIALPSAAELKTQLIISRNLRYTGETQTQELLSELNSISKMIQGLIKSLNY